MPGLLIMPGLLRLCQVFGGYARSSEVMPGLPEVMPGYAGSSEVMPGLLRLCQVF